MPDWVTAGFQEYAQRMPREMALELVEIPLGNRSKSANVNQARRAEAERIRAALEKCATWVALEVTGKAISTEQLAGHMDEWRHSGGDVAVVIGGPDGIEPELSQSAPLRVSLSRLTFPHALVRVMLAEQLYRAWTILSNHPYHRAG